MKKVALTIAIVLGMAISGIAQTNVLFDMGPNSGNQFDNNEPSTGLFLPSTHGGTDDANGTPLGGGALLLIGFGAAYALKTRKQK